VGNDCPAVHEYSPERAVLLARSAHPAVAAVAAPLPPTYQLPPEANTWTESEPLLNVPWMRVKKQIRFDVEPRGVAGEPAVHEPPLL
jgi:hypothetical protein